MGINRVNLDSFRTAASFLPPTKRSWTTLQPLKNPVHLIALFEALLLHRPLSSQLHPFLTPYRPPLAYPHGSHTGQWGSHTVTPVPFPVCGTLQSCSWMQIVDPSHWISFLWNSLVAQETPPGKKRSRATSYAHCSQQTPSCSVPLLKMPLPRKASQASSPLKDRLLKH